MRKITKKFLMMLTSAMLVFGTATVTYGADNTTVNKSESITIEDEKTPLAAAEDTCGIHRLVLLLTTVVIGYNAIRVVSESKAEQREISKQEA